MDKISDNEISTMLKLVAMGEVNLIPYNKLSAALQKIQSMQAENVSLKQQIDHIVEVGDSAYERLQAENDRLRKVEEKAKVFTKRIRIYPNEKGATVVLTMEELAGLYDALKGGS